MKSINLNSALRRLVFAVFGNLILLSGISCTSSIKTVRDPGPTASLPATGAAATPASVWQGLLEKTPVPFTSPLPASAESPIDGTYAKVDPSRPQWWVCLRCADYRPAGGIWKLQFDRGVMRIYYEVTGWRSIASFTVSGDRLQIFNDPYCPEDVGEYTWSLEDGALNLQGIDDPCAFDLRWKNLSQQAWPACPLSDESMGGPAPGQPPGCEETVAPPTTATPDNLPFTVSVHGGDSHFFEKPPDLFANANTGDKPSPDGIRIDYHPDSIPYGIHRVLWWQGDWIEASTDLPFTAMGVQFFGSPQIGWARVLFDGVEVWRGNTSEIWSKNGRHGGYIEIAGFSPGRHTIRAESLGFDYRPVTVASFGFRSQTGGVSETP